MPSSVGPVDLGSGRTAVAVSAGLSHTCALLDNDTVRCWGANGSGQLGYANTTTVGDKSPGSAGTVNLGAGRTAVAIAAGGNFTCALLDNDTVRCWGANGSGQLGYGNTTTVGDNETPGSVGPVDLGAGRTAVAISAGLNSACAILDNGTLRCWGANASGQLGTGTTENVGDNETPGSIAPVNLGSGRTATAVSVGNAHVCALLDNGTVKCWGAGAGGRLGYGNTNNVLNPGSVGAVDLGTGRSATAIAAGEAHTCAVLDDGNVRCWGSNAFGQLGYGNTEAIGDNETPGMAGPAALGSGRLGVAISAGDHHTCALIDNGTLRCWGAGNYGQLGYGNTTTIGDNETPGSAGPVPAGAGHGAVEVANGFWFTCALLDDGTVHCWGSGENGHLGYGNTAAIWDARSAGAVDLGGVGAVEIAVGEYHACALLANGTVYCWGTGNSSRLGYGNEEDVGDNETPAAVGPVNIGAVRVKAISSADSHNCVLLVDGTVKCWGWGGNGVLGYGNTQSIGDNETPAAVGTVDLTGTPGATAVEITAGWEHTCALLGDGSVKCWGYNIYGMLGYGNTTSIGDNETPGAVGPVSVGGTAISVAAGGYHTCALLGSRSVKCWGYSNDGQLGYGNTTTIGDNELPSSVGTVDLAGQSALVLTASKWNTCVILANGTVRCWGYNSEGQLGIGNTENIGDNETPGAGGPVDLAGESALDIAPGWEHTCAVMTSGRVRCWGSDTHGQLGFGDYSTVAIGDNETPGSVPAVDLYDNPPVAVNDSKTLLEDAGTTEVNVLANDTDIDGGPKEVASKTNGAHGTVAITSGGAAVTYTPNANYCGEDSFTYELNGGSTAMVSVSVTCVDDPPVAVNDSVTVNEDASPQTLDVLANDTDVDGGSKEIVAKTNGAHGTVAITAAGLRSPTPPTPTTAAPTPSPTPSTAAPRRRSRSPSPCVDDPPVAVDESKT